MCRVVLLALLCAFATAAPALGQATEPKWPRLFVLKPGQEVVFPFVADIQSDGGVAVETTFQGFGPNSENASLELTLLDSHKKVEGGPVMVAPPGGHVKQSADIRETREANAPWLVRLKNSDAASIRGRIGSVLTLDASALKNAALPAADVRFVFDFNALDIGSGTNASALKAACDSLEATTRDRVYPIMRDITGTSLAECFQEVDYKILLGNATECAGGHARSNQIEINRLFCVDKIPPREIHELLHVFNRCAGVLRGESDHIWHGAIMNAVDVRLGLGPCFEKERTQKEYQDLLHKIGSAPAARLRDFASGILGEQLTLVFFDHGEEAVRRLYRSTINARPASRPNAKLVAIWGAEEANKVEALLEMLKKDYNVKFDQRAVAAFGF